MTRDEAKKLARALRESRPYLLDRTPIEPAAVLAQQWTRDTFTNVAKGLADVVSEATGGAFPVDIFLSNARAVILPPYHCEVCGQIITDGKPCGHGQRDALGIE